MSCVGCRVSQTHYLLMMMWIFRARVVGHDGEICWCWRSPRASDVFDGVNHYTWPPGSASQTLTTINTNPRQTRNEIIALRCAQICELEPFTRIYRTFDARVILSRGHATHLDRACHPEQGSCTQLHDVLFSTEACSFGA